MSESNRLVSTRGLAKFFDMCVVEFQMFEIEPDLSIEHIYIYESSLHIYNKSCLEDKLFHSRRGNKSNFII